MGRIPGKRIVRPEDVATSVFDWGCIKFFCEPSVNNAEHLTVGHVKLAQGQGHLRHNHPGSEEILFILRGSGRQMVETDREENGGAAEYFDVEAGDMVHIPTSVFHETVNTGDETMELLAVYSPTGPEEVIRTLPDHRLVPPGPWPAE